MPRVRPYGGGWLRRPLHLGKRLCIAVTIASFGAVPLNQLLAKDPNRTTQPAGEWKIEIIPGPAIGPSPIPKAKATTAKAAPNETSRTATDDPASTATEGTPAVVSANHAEAAFPPGLTASSYAEVYNSIPFRRSEYLANPNYRHEATIEILIGQLRPKTVLMHASPAATCCAPRATSFVGFFNPWGAKNYYYHYSYSRPSSYWGW